MMPVVFPANPALSLDDWHFSVPHDVRFAGKKRAKRGIPFTQSLRAVAWETIGRPSKAC